MLEIIVKTILLLFFLFYVIDYTLFYIELDFYLKRKYQSTRVYKLMRRMGFWGRLNMFCPGSRISYYHYKVLDNRNKIICEFPDYRKIGYLKQLLFYRFRKTAYAGLKDHSKNNLLQQLSKQYGFESCTLHETKILMPYNNGKNKWSVKKYTSTTKWPLEEAPFVDDQND